MSFKLNLKYLLSFFAVFSAFALTGNQTLAQNRFPTTFRCIPQPDGLYVTIAQRGDRQTNPIFIWRTNWGSNYTPKKRCDIVSRRLTRAVETNGGKLSGLWMTYGKLNNYPIICYIRSKRERCNSQNILLTLRRSEFGREKEILEEMTSFSVRGTGSGVSRGRVFAPLGKEVDNAFNKNKGAGSRGQGEKEFW